jgi:hypothetical protein
VTARKLLALWSSVLAVAVVAGACSSHKSSAHGSAEAGHPASGGAAGSHHSQGGGSGGTSTTTGPVGLRAVPEAWHLPAAVSRPVVLPSGQGFLILGGLATGDVSTSRIVTVDPATSTSQLAGRLALAVHDSAGAVLGGQAFVFGGGSYSTVAHVQTWTSGVATETGSLPDSRSDLAAVTIGATAYIAGGFDGTTMTPDVLATTDGVSFRKVATLTVPVRYPALASQGQDLWLFGGVTSTSEGGTADTDAIQRVDLTTGQTTVVGHLPQAMGHATAITLDGTVFVLGGRSGTVPSSTIWRLEPSAGTVVAAGQLPNALSDAGSVVVGGAGYLVGGEITGPASPLDTVVALQPVAAG